MPIQPYYSNPNKRLYVNNPFIKGMYFTESNLDDGTARKIVNMDLAATGAKAYPRNSFINARINDGTANPILEDASVLTSNLNNDRFIIGAEYTCNKEDYVEKNDGDNIGKLLTAGDMGIRITKYEGDLSSRIQYTQKEELPSGYDYTYDGDTFYLLDGTGVRLIGIDAPEIGETGATEAKLALQGLLESATNIKISYEPTTAAVDVFGRLLVYVWYELNNDGTYHLANAILRNMLAEGAGRPEVYGLQEDWLFYEEILNAPSGITTVPNNDTRFYQMETYMSKGFAERSSYLDETKIYDTTTFYEETAAETTLLGTVDYANDSVLIEFLQHEEDNTYNKKQSVMTYVPNVNLDYKNAHAVLGRVIVNSVVKYTGMIIFQWGNTTGNIADNKFHILLVDPKEVNIGIYEATGLEESNFNMLDNDPFIYVDYLGAEASGWIDPTVLGLLIYDKDPVVNSDAKVLTKFQPGDSVFVKPYYALPTKTGAFQGYYSRMTVGDRVGAWKKITESDLTLGFTSEGYGWWGALNHNSGDTIKIEVTDNFMDYEVVDLVTDTANADVVVNFDDFDQGFKAGEYRYYCRLIGDEGVHPGTLPSGNLSFKDAGGVDLKTYSDGTENLVNWMGTFTSEADYFAYEVYDRDSYVEQYPFNWRIDTHLYASNPLNPTGVKISVGWNPPSGTPLYDFNVGQFHKEIIIKPQSVFPSLTSAPLIHGDKTTIDTENTIAEYDLTKATQIAKWDRFVILYGQDNRKNYIQFSEYDDITHFPYPGNAVENIDEEIIHIHPHKGNLVVFGSENIWLLHGGIEPNQLTVTKIYNNLTLGRHEKHLVKSLGKDVFFMINGTGYMLMTNRYVQDASDVNVFPITPPVAGIISQPLDYMKKRFKYSYGLDPTLMGDEIVKARTLVHASNNNLIIAEHYYVEESADVNYSMLVIFIYDRDTKRWRMYDTVVEDVPFATMYGNNSLGFELLSKRTCMTFSDKLPTNYEEQILGDYDGNNVYPIRAQLDTGNLNISPMHMKRFKKTFLNFANLSGKAIQFYIKMYTDGVPVDEFKQLQVTKDENGNLTAQYVYNPDVQITNFTVVDVDGQYVENLEVENILKLTLDTKGKGRVPAMEINLNVTDEFNMLDYGLVYRQKSAK